MADNQLHQHLLPSSFAVPTGIVQQCSRLLQKVHQHFVTPDPTQNVIVHSRVASAGHWNLGPVTLMNIPFRPLSPAEGGQVPIRTLEQFVLSESDSV